MRATSRDPRDAPTAEPILALHEGALYRIRVVSEPEWESMPAADRPRLARRVPGLGWICGEFRGSLN